MPTYPQSRVNGNNGGDYFAPTFYVASAGDEAPHTETWANCTYAGAADGRDGACYSTSVIGNATLTWIERALAAPQAKPLFAYIGVCVANDRPSRLRSRRREPLLPPRPSV